MKSNSTVPVAEPPAIVGEAWQQVSASFERFCLASGIAALDTMMEQDAVELCGPRYGHDDGCAGHRWARTRGKVGFHGGKVGLERPRVRARAGQEMAHHIGHDAALRRTVESMHSCRATLSEPGSRRESQRPSRPRSVLVETTAALSVIRLDAVRSLRRWILQGERAALRLLDSSQ